jgi:hypothetical protein
MKRREQTMCIPRTIFATLAVTLLCVASAAVARADTISFTGSRDVFNAPFAAPDTGRCGTPAPPNLLAILPPGIGTSNLGAFTTTENHCINVATRVISDGRFTFDFGGGNAFFGTYTGTVSPPVGGVVPISQIFTVTGGTGLFTGTSGSFTGIGARIEANGMANIHLDFNGTITTVPEPATVVLLGSGLAGVGAAVRKRRKVRDS